MSLNGQPHHAMAMLKLVAEGLVDVHGQHDHQYLFERRQLNQLDVLDQFGELYPLRQEYHETFEKCRSDARCKTIEELSASRSLRDQRLELYRFQAEEIDSAELDAAEYAELESRSSVLQNLEKLKKEAGAAHVSPLGCMRLKDRSSKD